MNIRNIRSRENQVYLSKLPPSLRKKAKAAQEKKEEPQKKSASSRFNEIVESAGLVIEGIDVGRAITWLNTAQQMATKRAEEITNMPEKDAYVKLATVIQAAIPINNATPESVSSNLSILRQQVQLEDSDSDQLRTLKVHLINKISEVLANPQEGTPNPEEAGGEEAPGTEQGAPAMPPGGAPAAPAGSGTQPPPQ